MGVMAVRWRLNGRLDLQDRLRFILVQRGTAFSAKIVSGPKLDEMAMVATYHFPGINRRQCCSHGMISECQSRQFSKNPLRGTSNDCEEPPN